MIGSEVRTWAELVADECSLIQAAGRWRSVRSFDSAGTKGTIPDGRTVTTFASNDYLGLTQHPSVKDAAIEAIERWGTGSGASRLVVGSRPVHHELESEIADWKGCESALVFSTGFAANLGVLCTFGSRNARILSDELNHASIIDGARLANAKVSIYRHCDVDHLAELLRDGSPGQPIVASDLVFSMDGDIAPLEDLVSVCAEHGALLVLDEAHSVIEPTDDALYAGCEVLRVGTLSKTLGSLGGFVAGRRELIELLVNVARPFIFTTAPTPADAAAALAAIRVVRSDEGSALRSRLRENVARVAPAWTTPIIPFVVGDEDASVALSAEFLDRGALVPAIRPPTVAAGTSRLRVALSAAHTDDDMDLLCDLLEGAGLARS